MRFNEELRMMNEDYSAIKQLKDVLSEANGNLILLLPEGGVPEGGGGRRNMPRKRLLF